MCNFANLSDSTVAHAKAFRDGDLNADDKKLLSALYGVDVDTIDQWNKEDPMPGDLIEGMESQYGIRRLGEKVPA